MVLILHYTGNFLTIGKLQTYGFSANADRWEKGPVNGHIGYSRLSGPQEGKAALN